MSTATTKRPHAAALAEARFFQGFFPPECYEQWHFAGSLRRHKPEVADVEHVIIPRCDAQGSLLWRRLEELVKGGIVAKHVYGDTADPSVLFESGSHRWGEKYRGVDFRGFNHELFTADLDNLGPTLALRTGPWEFSRMLVTCLRNRSLVNDGGYVWALSNANCLDASKEKVSVPTEEEYFKLCGVRWVPPEKRF